MTEYALTQDGLTVSQTRRFASVQDVPDYTGHEAKGDWKWLALTRLPAEEGEPQGYSLDVGAGTATYRPAFVAPVPRRTGTAREFMALFSAQEKAAILTAAQADVQVWLWLTEAMAGDVSLDHPTMAPALLSLEAGSIIGAGRADEILSEDFNHVS
jgi:hypothetical protein